MTVRGGVSSMVAATAKVGRDTEPHDTIVTGQFRGDRRGQ